MDAIDLVHYIRAWTPGPGYPDVHDGPFKEVFKFDNDALEAVKAFSERIRGECIIESKHMYQVGFEHGQQNVKEVIQDSVERLCESVNGDCYRGKEWEENQVADIRRILKSWR